MVQKGTRVQSDVTRAGGAPPARGVRLPVPDDEGLFYCSIDRTSVRLRVIAQEALPCNAGALIMWHKHPSGSAEPSPSDMSLTSRAVDLLEEVDVWLLDHIVVSRTETVSMAVAPRPALPNLQCVHSSMPANFIRWL